MDRDHRLDAPDNEALRTIEQLDDHSELTTLYPHGHLEWETRDLMSQEAREKKRYEEQLKISLTIRKWFLPIGLLVPLPAFIAVYGVEVAARVLSMDSIIIWLAPVVLSILFVGYVSYRIIKFLYDTFYAHAMQATPFLITLVMLLALSVHATFLVTEPLHTGERLIDALIVGGALLVESVLYSALLLSFWASPRVSSLLKLVFIFTLVVIVLAITGSLYLF